jgi:ssDNA-binding Zn-finger/Zn-ribbon topoisomerase 1
LPDDRRTRDREPSVGLCASCAHARVQQNARGSRFWRCALAEDDARFRRYPPLPVRECRGHEPGEPIDSR